MEDNSKYTNVYEQVDPAARFQFLDGLRQEQLAVARECSALTLPDVIPPVGFMQNSKTIFPEQSHGGRLVNNMVNQVMLILFPAGLGFFKLDFSSKDVKEFFKNQQLEDGMSMYEAARGDFISLEQECTQTFEASGYREKATLIMQQLVVAGNCLYITDADEDKMYLLKYEDWVCVRNNSGDVLEIIYRESIDGKLQYIRCWHNAPDELKKRWLVQRVDDSGTTLAQTTVLEKDFPVHLSVWSLSIGSDYGKSQVEENLADLRTFDTGSRIINETTAAMSKLIITVLPNGQTKLQDVTEAANCDVIHGRAEDIGTVQTNKQYDLSQFIGYIEGIKRSLDHSFMMADVIRRQAERVTAEEIQIMARELEKSKSGIYSSLTNTIQLPLANLTLAKTMASSQMLQSNPALSGLKPVIITGLQGLGRSFELESVLMFLNDVSKFPAMLAMLKLDQLIFRLANLRGVEIRGMIKTSAELAAEQQNAAMSQAALGAVPELTRGVMNNG